MERGVHSDGHLEEGRPQHPESRMHFAGANWVACSGPSFIVIRWNGWHNLVGSLCVEDPVVVPKVQIWSHVKSSGLQEGTLRSGEEMKFECHEMSHT